MRLLSKLTTITVLCWVWSGLPIEGNGVDAPTDPDEFVARVRAAVDQKDRDAIARLSYWEGVDDAQRKKQEAGQKVIFELPVREIELRPTPAGYRGEFVSKGTVYRLNLPVEGLLRIQFEGEFETAESRLYPYGIHEGRYYIARLAEIGPAEVVEREKQLLVGVMLPDRQAVADYVVSCSYDKDGAEKREKYTGERSSQKVLWGTKIHWCRVWNRSEDTSVQLVLKADLETYYESSQIGPGRTGVYP